LSAVCWDCVITAMPGMPKAYTPIVCVLSLGVRLEQPLAKLTMPPPIAPSSTGRIAAQSWRASYFQFTFSFIACFLSCWLWVVGCGCDVLRALLSACGWDVWDMCDAWGHLIFKKKMPESFAHERCLDHLMRNSMRKAPCRWCG